MHRQPWRYLLAANLMWKEHGNTQYATEGSKKIAIITSRNHWICDTAKQLCLCLRCVAKTIWIMSRIDKPWFYCSTSSRGSPQIVTICYQNGTAAPASVSTMNCPQPLSRRINATCSGRGFGPGMPTTHQHLGMHQRWVPWYHMLCHPFH